MTYKPVAAELRQLIGNPDVYAVQSEDGQWRPVRQKLDAATLRNHRQGEMTVGTYIVKPPDQARTLVFDIDHPSGAEQRDQARAVTGILSALSLHYGVEESGRKGFHVWVLADDYLPAVTLYRLGVGVREEAGLPKMEVFPKQTEVKDLGNLVKLPGGVHAVTGRPTVFLDEGDDPLSGVGFPKTNTAEALTDAAAKYPEVPLRVSKGEYIEKVSYPCVHGIQQGVAEGGRNTHLLHLSIMLRRFSLTEENVDQIVRRANALSSPPLDEDEVSSVIENSKYYGPMCGQLSEDKHCADLCILETHTKLYVRPGALSWAADGEVVTVEVESRTKDGTKLELSHPDADQLGRIVIREAKGKDDG